MLVGATAVGYRLAAARVRAEDESGGGKGTVKLTPEQRAANEAWARRLAARAFLRATTYCLAAAGAVVVAVRFGWGVTSVEEFAGRMSQTLAPLRRTLAGMGDSVSFDAGDVVRWADVHP